MKSLLTEEEKAMYPIGRDRWNASARKQRATNPQWREKRNAAIKASRSKPSGKKALQEKRKRWRKKNPDKMRLYIKKWKEANREKYNKYQRFYAKNRYKSDRFYAMVRIYRSRLNAVLDRFFEGKQSRSLSYLGCSVKELVCHIEKQFKDGMTWGNRGDWHVDHIIPLASAKTKDDLVPLLRFENLQPLWAVDNIEKSDKLEWVERIAA